MKMDTRLLDEKNEQDIKEAGKILRRGGLVAIPTETVYGLAGNALDPTVSAQIYKVKGRPSDNPLIVHIADIKELPALVEDSRSCQKACRCLLAGPAYHHHEKIAACADADDRRSRYGCRPYAVRSHREGDH